MKPEDFLEIPEVKLILNEAEQLKGTHFSDIIDDEGNQYVDLVQEGGGVLGIALVGYTYVLETAGIRFFHLAGTSAGAINTLVLGGIDDINVFKSTEVLKILATKDLFDFVDGNAKLKKIVQKLIEGTPFKKLIPSLLFNIKRIKNALLIHLGLNPGSNFENWLDDVLKNSNNKVSTIGELIEKLKNTHFPKGLKHRNGKLVEDEYRHLHIITADITTQSKVQFPRMAKLYWGDTMWEQSPAKMVRASMSVPFFFVPFEIDNIPKAGTTNDPDWVSYNNYRGPIPPKVKFVDGGMISNFPINVFHGKTGGAPRKPTFGVKLSTYRESYNTIDDLGGFIGGMVSTMRFDSDNEFLINNKDFGKLICHINADKDFNWLNFKMSDEKKKKLFVLGAKKAVEFLKTFNWEEYKIIREEQK